MPDMNDLLWKHDDTAYRDKLAVLQEIASNWSDNPNDVRDFLPTLTTIWRENHDRERHPWVAMLAAHLLADVQETPESALSWDKLALRSLDDVWISVQDPNLYNAALRTLPSLYLNLAQSSRLCGQLLAFGEYIRRAEVALHWLPACAYRDDIVRTIGQEKGLVSMDTANG